MNSKQVGYQRDIETLRLASNGLSFDQLLRLTSLDPMKHLRYANWTDVDFSRARTLLADFTGAILRGAAFSSHFAYGNIFCETIVDPKIWHMRRPFKFSIAKNRLAIPLARVIRASAASQQPKAFSGHQIEASSARASDGKEVLRVTVVRPDSPSVLFDSALESRPPFIFRNEQIDSAIVEFADSIARSGEVDFLRERQTSGHIAQGDYFIDGALAPVMTISALRTSLFRSSKERFFLHSVSPVSYQELLDLMSDDEETHPHANLEDEESDDSDFPSHRDAKISDAFAELLRLMEHETSQNDDQGNERPYGEAIRYCELLSRYSRNSYRLAEPNEVASLLGANPAWLPSTPSMYQDLSFWVSGSTDRRRCRMLAPFPGPYTRENLRVQEVGLPVSCLQISDRRYHLYEMPVSADFRANFFVVKGAAIRNPNSPSSS